MALNYVLVDVQVVSVTAAPKGRGIVVKTRKAKSDASAAAKATSTQILRASSGSRKAAKNVAQIVGSYRPDLTKVCWLLTENCRRMGH